MHPPLRLALFLLTFSAAPGAQPTSPPGEARKIAAVTAARLGAVVDLQQGNPAAALARLRAAASRGHTAFSEDAQVVGQLCAIARELEAATPGAGRPVALIAAAEGQRARPRLPRREAALLETQVGELQERVLGDAARARAHYQAALALDASAPAARRGLERLAWRDALIESKARENAALRQRAK
jgi:hypothetical protein